MTEAEHEVSLSDRIAAVKQSIRGIARDSYEDTHRSISLKEEVSAQFLVGAEMFGQDAEDAERMIQEKLSAVEKEVVSLIEEASDENRPEELSEGLSVKSEAALRNESKSLRSRIVFLKACSVARQHLEQSIRLSTPATAPDEVADLTAATECLQLAQQSWRDAWSLVEESNQDPEVKEVAKRVLDPIHASLSRQRISLVRCARETVTQCVSMSPESITVRAPEKLEVAYDVLKRLSTADNDSLERMLRTLTDALVTNVIGTILKSEDKTFTLVESNGGLASGQLKTKPFKRLEWTESDTKGMETDDAWTGKAEAIARLFQFVSSQALLKDEHLCSMVGRQLLQRPKHAALSQDHFVEHLTSSLVRDIVSTDTVQSNLDAYFASMDCIRENVVTKVAGALVAANFASADERVLRDVLPSTSRRYVEKRRATILDEGRSILINMDYQNTVEVGENSPLSIEDDQLGLPNSLRIFSLQRQSVSVPAHQLVLLCRKALHEATQSSVLESAVSRLLASSLFKTARNLMDLYKAIIKSNHGQAVANDPRTAAIFHNDCLYLSHCCLSLGLECQEKIPRTETTDPVLRQSCTFIDMVPSFRDLADRSLGDLLLKHSDEMRRAFSSRTDSFGASLQSHHFVSEWSDFEAAVTDSLQHVRDLARVFKPLLSEEIYLKSIAYLADTVYDMILEQVFRAHKISSNAKQFVAAQCVKVNGSESIANVSLDSALQGRFKAVGLFLDMSLNEIEKGLGDGSFQKVTTVELAKLISCCHLDSAERSRLLQMLRDSSA